MASPFAIDTTLTTNYDEYTAFSSTKQNTVKNEIVSKHNALAEDYSSQIGDDYSLKEIQAMILMGVYR